MKSQVLEKLQLFLNSAQIPEYENRVGFLEIIGKQYNENIISRLYAYFINEGEDDVRASFIDSLTELINNKSNKKFSLFDAKARTEVKSPKYGRIDLVIWDASKKHYILIENKIFHHLNNDLHDYWEYKPHSNEVIKIGVVLTLKEHIIGSEFSNKFINITHSEWVFKVRGYLKLKNVTVSHYLNDFLNTIENLTNTYPMEKLTEFYFKNAPKVIKVSESISTAHKFINNQMQVIAETLGWQQFNSDMDYRNIWDSNNELDVFLTILIDDILEGKMKFKIVLELCNEPRNQYLKLNDHLKRNKQLSKMTRSFYGDNHFIHFGYIEYIITFDELKTFSNVVLDKIKTDFAAVTIKAIDYFYNNPESQKWRKNDFWKEI